MLGLSEGKFIGGREGNSFEIASRQPRPIAVNQWRERGESMDRRGFESFYREMCDSLCLN
jgi:hypothetical protein